jgi:hypothetical protein
VIKLLKEKSNLLPASLAERQTTTAAWGQKFNNIAAACLLGLLLPASEAENACASLYYMCLRVSEDRRMGALDK